MANLKELATKVTVDEATAQFAGHFKTKSSSKNLLRKYNGAKLLAPIIEDSTIATTMLGTPETQELFLSTIITGFDAYVAKKAEWDAAKEKRPLPERVEFLRNIVISELEKEDNGKIYASVLEQVMELDTVKTCVDSGIDVDIIVKAVLASVIKAVMVSAVNTPTGTPVARDVNTGEEVIVEEVPPSDAAGHTAEEKPESSGDDANAGNQGAGEAEPNPDTGDAGKDAKKDKKAEIEKSKIAANFMDKLCDLLKPKANADDAIEADRIREGFHKVAMTDIGKKLMTFEVVEDTADASTTEEWMLLMMESALPAYHLNNIGSVAIDDAIKYGTAIALGGVEGDKAPCDVDYDKTSVAVLLGVFCMYSILASQISGHENLDYIVLPVLSEEVSKHTDDARMYKAFVNLSGVQHLDEYRKVVDRTIAKPVERNIQFAAARALSGFANTLCSKDVDRYIKRGMELYNMAA